MCFLMEGKNLCSEVDNYFLSKIGNEIKKDKNKENWEKNENTKKEKARE